MHDGCAREHAQLLFEEHSQFVFRTAFLLTKSKSMAEDITQETFIRVFKKLPTYDSVKPMRPWIYQIVLNITRNLWRRQKWLTFMGNVPDTAHPDTTENLIIRGEESEYLQKAIDGLTLKSREVVVLHFYLGMTLNEIASVIDVPLGTCKSRLHSALQALRRGLDNANTSGRTPGGETHETAGI